MIKIQMSCMFACLNTCVFVRLLICIVICFFTLICLFSPSVQRQFFGHLISFLVSTMFTQYFHTHMQTLIQLLTQTHTRTPLFFHFCSSVLLDVTDNNPLVTTFTSDLPRQTHNNKQRHLWTGRQENIHNVYSPSKFLRFSQ